MQSSLRPGDVLDIGGSGLGDSLKLKLKEEFIASDGESTRSFPTELCYFGLGLQLWDQVCWLTDYHQTRDEISLLEHHGASICREIPPGCTIVDMGSGDIRKPACLLQQLESLRIPVSYFALDISRDALEESMSHLANKYQYVQCYGLWGTFEDRRQWLRSVNTPKCILSMGSMFGNDTFDLTVERMQPWREVLGPEDLMLIGMDARGGREELKRMYHDKDGVWESFIRNGFRESNELLGEPWDVDCPALGLHVGEGEVIEFFESWKYGPDIMKMQFEKWDDAEGLVGVSSG